MNDVGDGVFVRNSGTNDQRWSSSGGAMTFTRLVLLGAVAAFFSSPADAATWRALNNGIAGTAVFDVKLDSQSSATIYIGTATAGFFKSIDGGVSWTAMNTGLVGTTVTALAVHPSISTTLYAGTQTGGVHVSTDGGQHWTQRNVGFPLLYVDNSALAIKPDAPSTLFVGIDDWGIYRSQNGGLNWSGSGLGGDIREFAFDPTNPQIAYASTREWVLKTTNGGNSWTTSSTGLPSQYTFGIAVNPANAMEVFVGDYQNRVYKSANAGATWTFSGTGLPLGSTVTALWMPPLFPGTIYAGTNGWGVFKSLNDGATWAAFSDGLTNLHTHIGDLTGNPNVPEELYVGTDAGLFTTSLLLSGSGVSSQFSMDSNNYSGFTRLSGTVRDEHGLNGGIVIPNALVELRADGGSGAPPIQVVADDLGRFSFPPLNPLTYPSGSYVLTATHVGYWDRLTPIQLTAGSQRFTSILLSTKTVILVHGINSDADRSWGQSLSGGQESFKDTLVSEGFHVFAWDLLPGQDPILNNSVRLLQSLKTYVFAAGIQSVDVVAHSMGGLIARGLFGGRVDSRCRKLITLSTPHHGTPLATRAVAFAASWWPDERARFDLLCELPGTEGLWTYVNGVSGAKQPAESFRQMAEKSDFLQSLNYGAQATIDHAACSSQHVGEIVSPVTQYYSIAGTSSLNAAYGALNTILGLPLMCSSDGIVPVESQKLKAADEVGQFWRDTDLGSGGAYHKSGLLGGDAASWEIWWPTNITRDRHVAEAVLDILKGNPVQALSQVGQTQQTGASGAVEMQANLRGVVAPGGAFTDSVYVDATAEASFNAVWARDSLELVLVTPTGISITRDSALTNPNIEFFGTPRSAAFTVRNVIPGMWTCQVLSVSNGVPDSVSILIAGDSNLTLSGETSPFVSVGQSIQVRATFMDAGVPLPRAALACDVSSPIGLTSSLRLLDDGSHGDGGIGDGLYGGSYQTSPGEIGSFSITVTGTADTTQPDTVRRICYLTSQADQLPEIEVTQLTLSTGYPKLGSVVTVTSSFRNIGAAMADSVTLRLENHTLNIALAETTLALAAGSTKQIQAQWLAVATDSMMFVASAVLRGVSEGDFTNNSLMQLALVSVPDTSGVSGVDELVPGPIPGGGKASRFQLRVTENPLRLSTRIAFTVPLDLSGNGAEIGVFDIAGRRVRTIGVARLEPGLHTIDWDGNADTGRPVGSGMYFVRLQVKDEIEVKKVGVVR